VTFASFITRAVIGLATVLVSACASHPVDTTPHKVKVDASNIVEVQKAGYIIQDKNGERLYCVKEQKTGSHIQTTTACLTEREWQRVHDASVQALQHVAVEVLPPPGH
jgi:hypothetical protein